MVVFLTGMGGVKLGQLPEDGAPGDVFGIAWCEQLHTCRNFLPCLDLFFCVLNPWNGLATGVVGGGVVKGRRGRGRYVGNVVGGQRRGEGKNITGSTHCRECH